VAPSRAPLVNLRFARDPTGIFRTGLALSSAQTITPSFHGNPEYIDRLTGPKVGLGSNVREAQDPEKGLDCQALYENGKNDNPKGQVQ
jgi:hypothetical protein